MEEPRLKGRRAGDVRVSGLARASSASEVGHKEVPAWGGGPGQAAGPRVRACGRLDEGGVQRPSVLLGEGAGLEQLLDEGGFLLLQLRDALALVRHLLGRRRPVRPPGPWSRPTPSPHLTWVSSRFCSFSMRMVCCCQPGAEGDAGAATGPRGPTEDEASAYRRAQSGSPGTASRAE